ncbi:MAG TPA: hypothetical protein VLT16_09940 [Candidatus Limnocylindrales bacterium]|nr:hypothetical protein [Candidatus Limnocylindrales bacterium]
MQCVSKAEKVFRAGDLAPESGVYTVRHQSHRPDHAAMVLKGERFPRCVQCGDGVRFVLGRPAAQILEDDDFHRGPESGRLE